MNINWPIIVAVAQVLFGAVGFLTGWIPTSEATTILMIGVGVFGIHRSNISLGRSLGARD